MPLLVDVEISPVLPVLPAVVAVDVGTLGCRYWPIHCANVISMQHIHSRQLHTLLTLPVLRSYTAGSLAWVARISGITMQYVTLCTCYFTLIRTPLTKYIHTYITVHNLEQFMLECSASHLPPCNVHLVYKPLLD